MKVTKKPIDSTSFTFNVVKQNPNSVKTLFRPQFKTRINICSRFSSVVLTKYKENCIQPHQNMYCVQWIIGGTRFTTNPGTQAKNQKFSILGIFVVICNRNVLLIISRPWRDKAKLNSVLFFSVFGLIFGLVLLFSEWLLELYGVKFGFLTLPSGQCSVSPMQYFLWVRRKKTNWFGISNYIENNWKMYSIRNDFWF